MTKIEVYKKKIKLEQIEKEFLDLRVSKWIRTADLLITNQLLYQLSYKGKFFGTF